MMLLAPAAFAEGWAVALLAVVVSVAIPAARAIAAKWRESQGAIKEQNRVLEKEAVKRTEALSEEKIKNMLLELKLEACNKTIDALERELDNWQSGRWSSER